jgi:hypothetical protein
MESNMQNEDQKNNQIFEATIRALESEIANIGAHVTLDSEARKAYKKQIFAMSSELRLSAESGRISWLSAATQAQNTRNVVMEIIRSKSTPIGLALAQQLKKEGKTLNELVARKTQQLHGRGAMFDGLSKVDQNKIYSEVVKSAGKSNPKVTAQMKVASHGGRGLIFLSIALSVYTVATAENKLDAAGKEIVITGVSIGGGIASGALAGLVCGPGAPVCVTVGAFVGGGLAAFGVGMIW